MADSNPVRSKWKREQPERYREFVRRTNLRVKYNTTPEEFDRLFYEQKGMCAVCGTSDFGKRGIFIDHNHQTKKVRGLLCHRCNTGLGYFRDNRAFLASAIKYLICHEDD